MELANQKEYLRAFLYAMCNDFIENQADQTNGMTLDFYFPEQHLGIIVTDSTEETLRIVGDCRVAFFKLGDIASHRILKLIPQVCNGRKIYENEKQIAKARRKFIKELMKEIEKEEYFNIWANTGKPEMDDPKDDVIQEYIIEIEDEEDEENENLILDVEL